MAKKTFTVKELKALLQGVDILHGNQDWCPDKQQWNRIRQKIDSLKEGSIEESYPPPGPIKRVVLTEPAPAIKTPPQPQEDPALERIRASLRQNVNALNVPAPEAGRPIAPPVMPRNQPGPNVVLPPASSTGSEFV